MKIFIAGATGTLGMPLVRELVARNHQVTGLTRSPEKRKILVQAGATAAIADALDAKAVEQALRTAVPDWVIDLLTAIPKNGPTSFAHMQATNVLRVKGTANLLRAAIAAGAKRIVAESMIFAYGFGDHGEAAKTEGDHLQMRETNVWLQEIVDAIRSLEDQLLTANHQGLIEAIPLRYGLFYGSESPSTEYMLRMIKKRLLPTISGSDGIAPWIHTKDAVSATIAAMEYGHPGEIYNVADDTPVSYNDMVRCAASVMGAKRPFAVPLWLIRWLMPYVAVFSSTRLRISNWKAKHDLQWQLQFPTYREGLRQAIADYESR